MASNKGGSVVAAVESLALPIAEKMGLILWDVRWLKEGSDWHLHIYLDKEGGVSLIDCENFYHAFDPLLDEADPIPHHYQLEIESPGIERALTRDFHFERSIGQDICITLIRPDENGEKLHIGKLVSFENGVITIDKDGQTVSFDKKQTAKVNICFED